MTKDIIFGLKGTAIRKRILTIHNEKESEKSNELSFNLNWIYGIAASIALVIAAWLLFPKSVSNEELFVKNFQPYPDLISSRGDDETPLEKGMGFYSAGEFESAITLLKKPEVSPDKPLAKSFYLGLSNLALKKPKEAIEYLKTLAVDDGEYEHQARWYLGLAYLLKEDSEKAISVFRKIKEKDFKYQESREIMNDL